MSTVDESLAKALGWKQRNFGYWQSPDGRYDLAMPLWTEDMNACLRDIVPVLRARGWNVAAMWSSREGEWGVNLLVRGNPNQIVQGGGVSLPAAFCEAALKALEAMK